MALPAGPAGGFDAQINVASGTIQANIRVVNGRGNDKHSLTVKTCANSWRKVMSTATLWRHYLSYLVRLFPVLVLCFAFEAICSVHLFRFMVAPVNVHSVWV